jgi:hypothetical protein
LLVPDATRNLYSVKQSLENCHTIKFDSCAGLLPQGKPHLFVPFIRDRSTDLYLLPLIVPPSRHNSVYDVYNVNTQGSVQNSTAAQGSVQAHEQPIQLLKQADNVHSKTPTQQQYLIDHHRLSHVQQPRIRDLNIKDITKQPKRRLSKTNCPTCIAFKSSKTNRPPATTPQDRKVDGPWQNVYCDLSGKFRIKSVSGAKYFCVFVCSGKRSQTCRVHEFQVSLLPRLSSLRYTSRILSAHVPY